jgi:hypothetical protein
MLQAQRQSSDQPEKVIRLDPACVLTIRVRVVSGSMDRGSLPVGGLLDLQPFSKDSCLHWCEPYESATSAKGTGRGSAVNAAPYAAPIT